MEVWNSFLGIFIFFGVLPHKPLSRGVILGHPKSVIILEIGGNDLKRVMSWNYRPPSNSQKWWFIGIPYKKWNNPGGDCYWVGDNSKLCLYYFGWFWSFGPIYKLLDMRPKDCCSLKPQFNEKSCWNWCRLGWTTLPKSGKWRSLPRNPQGIQHVIIPTYKYITQLIFPVGFPRQGSGPKE